MNIIGLGQCGCSITKCFEKFPQYKTFYINTEKIEADNFFQLKKQDSHEKYEEKCPDLSEFFKGLEDDVFFVLGGSGTISGSVLSILQNLKDHKITIIYVKPEIDLLSEKKTLQERVVYNVLQEYTRSGMFEAMYVFDNPTLEKNISDITIYNRYDKLNEIISFNIHMINVFENTKPVMSTISEFLEIARIGSMGSFDIEENLENLYFSLDNIIEKCYYYAIPEKQLKQDTELFRKITDQMKEKAKNKKTKISYVIHSTDYEKAHCYVVARSSQIQK